ncbi:Hypothetical protein NCS54_00583200 [Fusarium falciforme]|uniref:Hypothetical protein n=1 Tax=Fusarium falciforme TaxID=195108 RepID=UPI002300D598|nr:Hypothetical protein NCS54_00583200 [Fusarium falciforme]WAO88482.1 Hypothetical protein NCS54_00583200 [Fusarium falciforme]
MTVQMGLQRLGQLSNIVRVSGLNNVEKRSGNGRQSTATFDEDFILELSDSIRESLDRGEIGPRWEEAMGFLAAALRDEANKEPLMDLATIERGRLDRLVADITDPDKRPMDEPERYARDVRLAERLEWRWRSRFREHYFSIQSSRYLKLPKTGRLRGVERDFGINNPGEEWRIKDITTLQAIDRDAAFKPGHWWLNLACAQRDGIVDNPRETPTVGHLGGDTLPLLTGEEFEDPVLKDTTTYIRNGGLADMHVSLITKVGTIMRVLRGHNLNSPFAPRYGVRYDGLYKLAQYGQRFYEKMKTDRMFLILERVKTQPPIEDFEMVPRPSQIDDWGLYSQYAEEQVKKRLGDKGFLN